MKNIDNIISTITLGLVLGTLFLITLFFDTKLFAYMTSSQLKEEVIRFHVVANSNITYDQLLKENVRDNVLTYMEPLLSQSQDLQQSKQILLDNMDIMQNIATEVVENWGMDYEVKIEISNADFPTRRYGDVVFPAGEYEACRILIGDAIGENWWCIMYPPLCYVDVATGVVPKEEVDEYEICQQPYKIGFKLVEWLF
ncbi:MAG: stage II sporulation protein R [Epulopiscium sp. Nuni2H_MBin003]|nr:MAG: stage II sporulation protein R [Epulopiscium sp. Nuni2H_MBin003]